MSLHHPTPTNPALTAHGRKEHSVLTRKRIIVLLAMASLAIAGIAGAYYAGSGSGSNAQAAKAGASPQSVSIVVDSNASALYPGDSETITSHITSANGRPRIGTVNYTVTPSAAAVTAGCLASWFSADPSVVNAQTPQDITTTLYFNESNTDQSACSNADISVSAQATP